MFCHFHKEDFARDKPFKIWHNARVRFFILVLLILVAFFAVSKQEPHSVEKNIFGSKVFKEFALAQGLPLPNSPKEALEINERYIAALRTGDLQAVRNYYLGSDLTPSYKAFLAEFIPPYRGGDFFHYLRESLAVLKSNQQHKKGKTTFSDDTSSEGNLPFVQCILPEGTMVIRMGLPMIEQPYWESFLFPPKINPEFILFIRSQQKHLYINLMKREGLEAPYTYALEDLKEPSLRVVTLDKNSDFYWQNGEYPSSSQQFKKLFYQKMKDPKGSYFLPKELDLIGAIDRVHTKYFQNKEALNTDEKKDFIELTYLEILDQLVSLEHPDSVNVTCKHAIDRGPSLAVLWQLARGLADEPTVAALLLAPPLLMHNRTAHESRIERFISAAKFLVSEKKGRS